MEELFNLTYKKEIENIQQLDDYEKKGDEKFLHHIDKEARLLWAFYRPSGSLLVQIADEDSLVSIMAFNHSKERAIDRFKNIHKDVINNPSLRVKIRNRTRMLFRDLVDNDFKELNEVLEIVPVFLNVAIEQLKIGRKWNDIEADLFEATKFLETSKEYIDEEFLKAFYLKLKSIEELELVELKEFLEYLISIRDSISEIIIRYFVDESEKWLNESDIHILQKKAIEKLIKVLK